MKNLIFIAMIMLMGFSVSNANEIEKVVKSEQQVDHQEVKADEKPDWIYEDGVYYWDGLDDRVVDMDSKAIWHFNRENSEFTYLGELIEVR